MIPLMTELDEPFSEVDGVFKQSVDKLIAIHDLIIWKTTEFMIYDVVQSYEYPI